MGKNKSINFLDLLIKILTIFLLFGAILLLGIYLKKMLNPKEMPKQTLIVNEAREIKTVEKKDDKNQSKVSPKEEKTIEKNSSGQKLYTEDEMQEILQMMIDQMQELNDSNQNKEKDGSDLLTQSLMQVEEEQNLNDSPIKELDASKLKAQEKKKNDTFNKVIINKSSYDSNNINKLQEEIGSIIKSVSSSDTKSKYTKSIKKELKVRKDSMRFIVVRRGDTLSHIAKRAYGRVSAYKKILDANRDLIRNKNRIYVGQKLRIPKL